MVHLGATMSRMYQGRDWINATAAGTAVRRSVPRQTCPGCGEQIAVTAMNRHAWSAACEAMATEKRLLSAGWVVLNRRLKFSPERWGVEVRTGRRPMVQEWVHTLLYSCRQHQLYQPILIGAWAHFLAHNAEACRFFMRGKRYTHVKGTYATVSDNLIFVGLMCDITRMIDLSSGAVPSAGLSYKQVAKWLGATANNIHERITVITDAELHEVAIAASRAALYIEEYALVYPGAVERGAVNYRETILARATKLREICHANRDTMGHAEPSA